MELSTLNKYFECKFGGISTMGWIDLELNWNVIQVCRPVERNQFIIEASASIDISKWDKVNPWTWINGFFCFLLTGRNGRNPHAKANHVRRQSKLTWRLSVWLMRHHTPSVKRIGRQTLTLGGSIERAPDHVTLGFLFPTISLILKWIPFNS